MTSAGILKSRTAQACNNHWIIRASRGIFYSQARRDKQRIRQINPTRKSINAAVTQILSARRPKKEKQPRGREKLSSRWRLA